MGSGCKPDGFAYGGSNPSRPTTRASIPRGPRRARGVARHVATANIVTIERIVEPRTARESRRPPTPRRPLAATEAPDGVRHRARSSAAASRARRRSRREPARPPPFDGWGFLWRPALLGFVALVAIAVGSSFSNSPFKPELPGTWFFGVPTKSVRRSPPVNSATMLARHHARLRRARAAHPRLDPPRRHRAPAPGRAARPARVDPRACGSCRCS